MSLGDVTRAGVLAAVGEFDRVGRTAFLKMAGLGAAPTHFLDRDGKFYDSKAIVGYAHVVVTGVALSKEDFGRGDKSAAQRLEALGFKVVNLRRPTWTRDEIILACALAETNDWRQLSVTDPRAVELSQLLQRPVIHPFPHHPDFRSAGGVGQKIRNIVDNLPDHQGPQSNGNELDGKVLDDFRENPTEMRAMAVRIREVFTTADTGNGELPDLDSTDTPVGEGGVALRAHLRRERDPKIRRRKLDDTRFRKLPIACEACGFDFGQAYGTRGMDYIECHHRVPLHVTGVTETRVADLALLCSNCHRMIHRTKKWLTVEELKDLVEQQRKLRG